MARICGECGESVDSAAEFCPACLASIETAASPSPIPTPAHPPLVAAAPAKNYAPWIIGAFVGGLLIAGVAFRMASDKQPVATPVPQDTSAPADRSAQSAAPQKSVRPQAPVPAPLEIIPDDSGNPYPLHPTSLDPTGDNWLALRSEPDLRGVRIDKLGPDARFRLVARHGLWWKVELPDGRQGWVSSKFVGGDS